MSDQESERPAGDLSSWLRMVELAVREGGDAAVPCGECTACCTSRQFVHIERDEADALARIPPELVFPAPGRSDGLLLLGYDEQGNCPMLADGRCSIYDDRPRTCRSYDCRIFAATEVDVDPDKPSIADTAGQWVFDIPSGAAVSEQRALRAAAAWIDEHREELPEPLVPRSATHLAVLATLVHRAFLVHEDVPDRLTPPRLDDVLAELGSSQGHVQGSRNRPS